MGFCTWIIVILVVLITLYVIALLLVDCDLRLAWATKLGKSVDALGGKVVWITGASSGIGEHIALALAKGGAKLVLSARRFNELERVKQACLEVGKNLRDPDILVLPMDVTVTDRMEFHFRQVLEHFGKLDILVNNAGRSQRAMWEDIELGVDREMFDLNVFGVIALSRIVVRHFQKKKEGHVVVTSSLAGVKAAPFSGSYSGAKHALHGYFDALRIEKLESNISVTLLCPGPVFSNFLAESFTDRTGEKFGQSVETTDRRMTTERCGYLCAVAIANKLEEAWMALSPIIPLYYVFVYYPNIRSLFLRYLGARFFLKMRDSKIRMEIRNV
ncbi:dehydrogenase/reductase SDR family member 7-like isoform X2 [Periplaneta americana]